MADKLELYNAALRECGDTRLATLTDSVEARFVMDGLYDRVLRHCIEAGQWNFAMRDASIASTATPAFGYSYSFPKPADWVRTCALSAAGDFFVPLEDYVDQVATWQANVNPIFVKYVSSGTSYGLNLALWPESFTRYVEMELAWRYSRRGSQSDTMRENLSRDRDKAKSNALAKDAMNQAAPQRIQPGRFVRSRYYSGLSRRIDPLIS